jgi:AraC-like DNA-binding protein
MKIYIKNMVCNRCIMAVRHIFEECGYTTVNIVLGIAETDRDISSKDLIHIEKNLKSYGFEIIDKNKSIIIENIKTLIISLIHYNNDTLKINFSAFLESKLKKDYTYLSNLFSSVEGITIEKFIIHQKVERIKELLVYDELNITEIADKLGYSSIAYLSNQFKKITGLSPSHFKEIGELKRSPIDKIG